MGLLHAERGETDDAERTFRQARNIARARGDTLVESSVEQNYAELLISQHRDDEAVAACERAMALAMQRGDRLRRAGSLKLRARVERARRDYDAAIGSLAEACELARASEDSILEAELLCDVGEVWRLRGERAVAGAVWTEALATFTKAGAHRAATDTAALISGADLPVERR